MELVSIGINFKVSPLADQSIPKCRRHVAEHSANWDLMSAAGSVAAIDDPVSISSGDAWICSPLLAW